MTAELVIKVSIADDHKIFRDGIKMALKNKEYLRILWEAEDGKDLVHKMQIKRPDVLLMDIRMPEVDGPHDVRRPGNDLQNDGDGGQRLPDQNH